MKTAVLDRSKYINYILILCFTKNVSVKKKTHQLTIFDYDFFKLTFHVMTDICITYVNYDKKPTKKKLFDCN